MSKPIKKTSEVPPMQGNPTQAARKDSRSLDAEIDSLEGGPPLLKCHLRYYNPFAQAEAELDFIGRKEKCNNHLESLKKEINQGRIIGLRELMLLAYEATLLLNRIAKAEPGLTAVIAEHYNAWPVLWNGRSFSKPQQDLLDKIHLGSTKPDIVERKRIGQDPPLSRRWALLLLKFIAILRSLKGVKDHPPGVWGLAETPLKLEIPTDGLVAGDTSYLYPKHVDVITILRQNRGLDAEVEKLESFTPTSAPRWWTLAEKVLWEITKGDFRRFPGLEAYARTAKVTSLTRSKGTQWAEVVKAIKPVFLQLAD